MSVSRDFGLGYGERSPETSAPSLDFIIRVGQNALTMKQWPCGAGNHPRET